MRPYPIGNGTVSPRIPREFAALLDALQLEGSNTDALLALDDADWGRLLEFCDLAHLALPLSQIDMEDFPDWVVRRLEQNLSDNARRFERVRAAYVEAGAAMARAGVSHLVMKGFTQAPDYVGDPRLRMQSDIDIFCPERHVETAQSALMKIGYRPVEGSDFHADHLPALSRPGTWKWRGNAYDPEMPPGIEVHFCLWNQRVSLIEVPEVQHFWERRVIRRIGNMEFCALHPVDHLGHLALHILRGVMSGDWVVHHVYEMATFLHNRTRDVEFWSQWYEMHSANLRGMEALAFILARNWFSCPLPEVVRVEADRLPPGQKRWLHRFGGAPLEAMFRHNKDGRLLQLLLTRSRTSRHSVLRKVMLPARVPGLNAPAVRIRYRRARPGASNNRFLHYAHFLARTSFANATANISFLMHGVSLWVSTRALSTQFWVFLGACFLFDFGASIYFFFFNLFLSSHGYSEAQLGVLTSTMAAGNLAGALPAGRLMQRWGLRNALITCTLAGPVVLCARALSLTFPLQVGLAFLTGVALCLWAVCIAPTIAAITPQSERPLAFSLVFSLGIGMGAAGALAGSRMPGWFAHAPGISAGLAPDQLTLIAACLIAALAVIPAMALRTQRTVVSPRQASLFSPAVRRVLPAVAIWGLVAGSFFPFANVFLAVHLRLPLRSVGTVFSISQLCQVAAVLCAPMVLRRLGVSNGVFTMQIAVAFCFMLLALNSHPLAASVTYVALTAAQYMGEPGISAS